MKQTKPAFRVVWLMEILKIYLEKKPLIKYYKIKHFILQNMMDINLDLLQWFITKEQEYIPM